MKPPPVLNESLNEIAAFWTVVAGYAIANIIAFVGLWAVVLVAAALQRLTG